MANKMMANGPEYGIVVLDFGKPDILYQYPLSPLYRTRLVGTDVYLTFSDIETVAGDFATGFYNKASTDPTGHPPQIVLAVGTSNYWSPGHPFDSTEFYNHGVEWGNMVKDLNTKYQKIMSYVTFQGADDIEFAWSDADHVLKWAQGFEEATRPTCELCAGNVYYVYGSCDDCYWPGHPDPDPARTILENYHPEATLTPGPGYATSTPIPYMLDEAYGAVSANRDEGRRTKDGDRGRVERTRDEGKLIWPPPDRTELLIIDEADRLRMAGLEPGFPAKPGSCGISMIGAAWDWC